MKEIFRPIKGYEKLYEISNYGRIKSLERKSILKYSNSTRIRKETILNPGTDTPGYLYVILWNGKRVIRTIHTLVWDAFGDKPRNGRKIQVDHKDNNKQNNRIDNLQLLTHRENISKMFQQIGTKYGLPTGVAYQKNDGGYQSSIWINGKNKYLGYFKTAEEASLAYQKALLVI